MSSYGDTVSLGLSSCLFISTAVFSKVRFIILLTNLSLGTLHLVIQPTKCILVLLKQGGTQLVWPDDLLQFLKASNPKTIYH